MILDQDLDGDRLFDEVFPLLRDEALRQNMAQASKAVGRPDAAERAARLIVAEVAGVSMGR